MDKRHICREKPMRVPMTIGLLCITVQGCATVQLPKVTRNLGDQLGSVFSSGAVRYTVSGVVVLRDFSLIGVPYSVAGQVTPQMVAGGLVGMADEQCVPGPCGRPAPAPGSVS